MPRPLPTVVVLVLLPLAACGGRHATLPPRPSPSGAVALSDLAHSPEVYADAYVVTVGSVARVHGSHTPLFVLDGGHGVRIILEPSSRAAAQLGQRVRVSGLFTVTFALGYEIVVSRIARSPRR